MARSMAHGESLGAAVLGAAADRLDPVRPVARNARVRRPRSVIRCAPPRRRRRMGSETPAVRFQMPSAGDGAQLDIAPKAPRPHGRVRRPSRAAAEFRRQSSCLGRGWRNDADRRAAGPMARDPSARRLRRLGSSQCQWFCLQPGSWSPLSRTAMGADRDHGMIDHVSTRLALGGFAIR